MNDKLPAHHKLPEFSAIRMERIEADIERLLADNATAIESLLATCPDTWISLVEPLEELDDRLKQAWNPIQHLHAVMSSEALRKAYNACLPKLSDYATRFAQNTALEQAWKRLADSHKAENFDVTQRQLIEHTLRDFRLAGVDLPDKQKQRFRELSRQLATMQARFEENLLDATQAWFAHVKDERSLAGIPAADVARARKLAESNKHEGWMFGLDFPSYKAVITYADDASLRRDCYTAYVTRASDQGQDAGRWDNSANMSGILKLRYEMARLVGFDNYAEFSLATKMVGSAAEVLDFLTDLVHRCRSAGEAEFHELVEFAAEQFGVSKLQAWDIAYYSEKLRLHRYALSQEHLRPYFPLPRVLEGMFEILYRLYGIKFKSLHNVDVWHPDVRVFELHDSGGPRGLIYMDFYARPGKRSGAWMDNAISRRRTAHGLQRPVAYLVCNFAAGDESTPALLTHEDVITLFHETGHCLHHLLTRVDHPGVGGIEGVPWDAVELPSQLHENFVWCREGIELVSAHYQTGEPLPAELWQRLQATRHFQSGLRLLRQLEFALFDMRLHMASPDHPERLATAVLAEVRRQVAVLPIPDFNRFAHSFSHIFAGGYAAGYYSYLWAEVLAADAFSAFESEKGLDWAPGRQFMSAILEQGGSRDAKDLFRQFRGRDVRLDAFLRSHGITRTSVAGPSLCTG